MAWTGVAPATMSSLIWKKTLSELLKNTSTGATRKAARLELISTARSPKRTSAHTMVIIEGKLSA